MSKIELTALAVLFFVVFPVGSYFWGYFDGKEAALRKVLRKLRGGRWR